MVAASAGFTAVAQLRGGDNFYAQKMVIDLNFPVGVMMQAPTYMIDPTVYPNLAASNIGKLKMGAGLSYGADLQFGYFIGKGGKFGIGTGISYFAQHTVATIGNFRVEYEAMDKWDNTYRQVVSATHAITEKIDIKSINIPLMLKFKQRFTTRIGFTIDAGILYNVSNTNSWKTDAEFDYEAVYKFTKNAAGADVTVYDNAATPGDKDWLITKDQYERTHTKGTANSYIDSMHIRGYSVALGVKPTINSGSSSYTTGSIGFMLRPAVSVRLTKRIHANLGAYYSYQSFDNHPVDNYKVTSNMGATYSSLLNSVTKSVVTNFGLNVGLRYFIGTPKDSNFDGKYDE